MGNQLDKAPTPTTKQIRAIVEDMEAALFPGLFDRWLAEHDAEVRADTLRQAATYASANLASEVSGHTSVASVRRWLNERADSTQRPLQADRWCSDPHTEEVRGTNLVYARLHHHPEARPASASITPPPTNGATQ